jgi:hypothetical protein
VAITNHILFLSRLLKMELLKLVDIRFALYYILLQCLREVKVLKGFSVPLMLVLMFVASNRCFHIGFVSNV